MGLKFLILKWMLILKIVNFEELWKHSSFYVKILKLNQKEADPKASLATEYFGSLFIF